MPPELDVNNPVKLSLRDYCPQAVLDCFAGWACLVDPDLTIQAINRGWDEGMSRGHRTDLLSETIWNKPFLSIFGTAEQQLVFRKLLQAMAERNLTGHSQVVDFTNGSRPFHLQLNIHPLFDEEVFVGYVLTAVDATSDHLHRLALNERDKKVREIRKQSAEQRDQFKQAMNRLADRHTAEVSQLTAMTTVFAADPQAFPEHFCKHLMELSGSLYATIYEYHSETQTFRLGALYNAPDFYEMAKKGSLIELSAGEAPCGLSAAGRKPVRFDNIQRREDFAPWAHIAEEHDYHCIWAFPIVDGENTYGALQLYFRDPEQNFSSESVDLMQLLCGMAAPLLFCVTRLNAKSASQTPVPTESGDGEWHELQVMPDAYRYVAGGLAEEFSNLLTGVLGHSSLAAAELGESHPALTDVRAMEKSARSAARLTRRLTALSGEARRANPIELGQYLTQYVEKDRGETFAGNQVSVSLPVVPCPVRADNMTMEVILDGMVEHAFAASNSPAMLEWKLLNEDDHCRLTLRYEGPVMAPRGWDEEEAPQPMRHRHYELFLSREATRALGGDLYVEAHEDGTELVLTLPCCESVEPEPSKSAANTKANGKKVS